MYKIYNSKIFHVNNLLAIHSRNIRFVCSEFIGTLIGICGTITKNKTRQYILLK